MKLSKILLIIILLLLVIPVVSQETGKAKMVTEDSIKADVEKVKCSNKERLNAVKELFIEHGASENEIKIDDFKDVKNLVVTKKGSTAEIVVVGAHYDFISAGCGAIDNWTGISIIANLFETISKFSTEKTFKFVAFGREEEGLIGSKAMVKQISKEDRINYCAMINLDSFGFTVPQALGNISNDSLIYIAEESAKEFDFPFSKVSIGNASSDSESFKTKKIPAITLHGLSNNHEKFLHTSKDSVKNINFLSVFLGYKFTLLMLAKIDAKGCQEFRK